MKLDSLFTDLDPLGTGKSKPYTDKKNFFAVKATPMMGSGGGGGAVSQDALCNARPQAAPLPATDCWRYRVRTAGERVERRTESNGEGALGLDVQVQRTSSPTTLGASRRFLNPRSMQD